MVVDTMEVPLPGTILVLIPEPSRSSAALAFSPVMGFTQPDGTFQMNGVPSGEYRLVTMGSMTSLEAAGTAGSLGGSIIAASDRFDVPLDAASNASPGQRVVVENADVSDLKVVVASRR
jgi:hypothetical protein